MNLFSVSDKHASTPKRHNYSFLYLHLPQRRIFDLSQTTGTNYLSDPKSTLPSAAKASQTYSTNNQNQALKVLLPMAWTPPPHHHQRPQLINNNPPVASSLVIPSSPSHHVVGENQIVRSPIAKRETMREEAKSRR